MKKDYSESGFIAVCIGIAILFGALGTLAYFSSISAGWKIFTVIGSGIFTLVYLILAWIFRPKKQI